MKLRKGSPSVLLGEMYVKCWLIYGRYKVVKIKLQIYALPSVSTLMKSMQVCMQVTVQQVVIFQFSWQLFEGFLSCGGGKLPSPIDLAHGLYTAACNTIQTMVPCNKNPWQLCWTLLYQSFLICTALCCYYTFPQVSSIFCQSILKPSLCVIQLFAKYI